ncbi:hypothetical protein HDC30_002434 [Pseudomonas sp. JAI115]|uniref:hypothetical protein n=1 Tax=Pseudomonas sp. JAI115 TaxID=2723061 RepID=UPI00162096EF|nr:hypothetical protein [Pseudomonas sp. JAI115]MBB6155211.1 hypothetical protein [Pseudomonas sp. JAI115]
MLETPDHWLGDLSAALEPIEPQQTPGEQPVAMDLIAGRIEQQTLVRLRPGDALLCRRYPIAEGVLDVCLHRPLAILQGAALEDGVQPKGAGRTIAHGLLLDIEGRLAVRIERLA